MRPTVEILLVLDFEYSGTRAHGHLAKLIIRAIPDVAFAEVGTEIIWRVDQLLPPSFALPEIRWNMRFKKGSPFVQMGDSVSVDTKSHDPDGRGPRHTGRTE